MQNLDGNPMQHLPRDMSTGEGSKHLLRGCSAGGWCGGGGVGRRGAELGVVCTDRMGVPFTPAGARDSVERTDDSLPLSTPSPKHETGRKIVSAPSHVSEGQTGLQTGCLWPAAPP